MINNIAELIPKLKGRKKITITTHAKPDADALGSSLGLKHYLELLDHDVKVIVPSSYPYFIEWMPGNRDVLIFNDAIYQQLQKIINQSDFIICTDFSRLERIDDLEELVRNSNKDLILIDHHLNPEKFAKFELWDSDASSASELVYRFIEELGGLHLINQDIASCLYAGIMTDTGSFRFPSTSPTVHRILAKLMETGIDHSTIHRNVYENNTESKLRLLGYSISNKLKICKEYNSAYILLSKENLTKFDYKQGDTEGIVNYALSLAGISFAGIFIENEGEIKISFRSVGDFNVAEFSSKYFNGGGHKNAAGGGIVTTLENVEKIFLSLLPKHREHIIKSDKK